MSAPFEKAVAQALHHWPYGFSLAVVSEWGDAPFEDHSVLRVRGSGHAELSVTRGQFDQPQVIGRFEGTLDPQLVKGVAGRLSKLRFSDLRASVPAGSALTRLELTAAGAATILPLPALDGQGTAGLELLGALQNLGQEVRKHPAAALSLSLAARDSSFELTVERLGPAPLLGPNPRFTDRTPEPFLTLKMVATAGSGWETFELPLDGTVFEQGGRLTPLPERFTMPVTLPPGFEDAVAVQAIYGSYDRPPGLRVGGVDVFGRVVASNALERGSDGAWR